MRIRDRLKFKLSQLDKDKPKNSSNRNRENLENAKWTGQRPQNMTSHEFDRAQKDDDLGR